VYTSFAGMFGHLLALPPFLAGWLLCADGGLPRGVAAATLLFGSVAALSNAVPFLRLDGYHMLNHALGMTDLAGEANRFWRALLRRSDPAGLAGYPRADRWIYGVYGAASAGFSVLAGAAFTWYLAGHVAGWLEVRRDVVALAAVGVFAASYLGFACWRRRRALKV
jgi:putative peptide zinc metalloprotease protein